MLAIIFSLCSCTNEISYKGMKAIYNSDPNNSDALAYLVAYAFEENNMKDTRKYAEKFLFCSDKDKEANMKGLDKVLTEVYGVTEGKEEKLIKLHDSIVMYYTVCMLFDDNGNPLNFKDLLPSYLKCCNMLLQSFEQTSVDFSSVVPECNLDSEKLKIYFSFLHYSLPYVDSEQAFCTTTLLNVMYNKYTDINGSKFFKMADYLVSGALFDEKLYQTINSTIRNNEKNSTSVTIEEIKQYLDELQLPIDVRETKAFFKTVPSSSNNAIFLYETDDYNIVFYGVPSNTVEIVCKTTGEIIYERFT